MGLNPLLLVSLVLLPRGSNLLQLLIGMFKKEGVARTKPRLMVVVGIFDTVLCASAKAFRIVRTDFTFTRNHGFCLPKIVLLLGVQHVDDLVVTDVP